MQQFFFFKGAHGVFGDDVRGGVAGIIGVASVFHFRGFIMMSGNYF